MQRHIAIVGRGILGLSAAYRFTKAGFKVSLFGLPSQDETASLAAVGVSSIKGQTLSRSPLFKAKVLGHQNLKSWIQEIERDANCIIPHAFSGVFEPFLNLPDFQKISATVYRGQFNQFFEHRLQYPDALLLRLFSRKVKGFFFILRTVGFLPHI